MGTHKVTTRPELSPPTSVADALFPKGRQRVLAVLYGNVDRSFYANEIIRLAGTGTGAVQRELESLADAGLVTVTRVGNQKHFQANAQAAVYTALHDLVLKTCGVADVRRAARNGPDRRHLAAVVTARALDHRRRR